MTAEDDNIPGRTAAAELPPINGITPLIITASQLLVLRWVFRAGVVAFNGPVHWAIVLLLVVLAGYGGAILNKVVGLIACRAKGYNAVIRLRRAGRVGWWPTLECEDGMKGADLAAVSLAPQLTTFGLWALHFVVPDVLQFPLLFASYVSVCTLYRDLRLYLYGTAHKNEIVFALAKGVSQSEMCQCA